MSIQSATGRLNILLHHFKERDISLILQELYFFFKRNIDSEFLISSRIDCICFPLFLIMSMMLENIFKIKTNMAVVYARNQEYRIANYIENKYGVKFVYRFFPLDIFWRDYFQRSDFIKNNDVIIDVGANIGDFSIIVAKCYEESKIIAIEPYNDAYGYLIKNITINNLENQIIPVNAAAWKFDGEILLQESEKFLTCSGDGISKLYKCRSLDLVIKEFGLLKVDLVKIDTEGSELNILEGSKKLLNILRPKIIIETHSESARKEVRDFLFSFKYDIVHEKSNFPEPLISVMYFIPK